MSTFLTIIKSILSVAWMLFRYAFYRAVSSFLTGLVLLFIAVLMFITFYQAYMPVVSHVKPVYLQFSSDCQGETSGLCTFPEASVFFTSSNKGNEERMLMRGQAYKVFLDLEMPPSPTNEKLGMFMVNIKFLSAKGMVLRSSSRSCMLHYESSLVRLFRTIFYSLPLTLGITEEKQKVELNFFDDYIDDSYNPAVQAKVVIMTKQVEIYSSTLRLQASFTGLRYLIFNWPVLFSCVAILGNFITVTLLYSACINQFMPSSTPTIASRVPQQQNVANAQSQNTSSQLNSGSTSTAVSTLPAVSVEAVSSNAERQSEPRNSQPEEPSIDASTSSGMRKRHITRYASVKLKFHRKQLPKLGNAGQRRVKRVKIGRIEVPDLAEKSLNDEDYPEVASNQNTASSDYSFEIPNNDLADTILRDPSRDSRTSLDEIKSISKSSPTRVGHVRKRRKADFDTKTMKERPCSQSKTWRIVSREVRADKLGKNIPKGTSSENKENRTCAQTLGMINSRSLNETRSVWDNLCISKNWEYFKFPRIRRLGMYLQEALPSVSQNIRHCVSDLELTSVEEKRLNDRGSGSPKRSVSASDITLLDGANKGVSEICQ